MVGCIMDVDTINEYSPKIVLQDSNLPKRDNLPSYPPHILKADQGLSVSSQARSVTADHRHCDVNVHFNNVVMPRSRLTGLEGLAYCSSRTAELPP